MVNSGFSAIKTISERFRRELLDGYLDISSHSPQLVGVKPLIVGGVLLKLSQLSPEKPPLAAEYSESQGR
jgi:hypothetical protein